MKRRDGSIRVMGGSGYKISIAVIAVLAAALMVFMLIILPAMEAEADTQGTIISIEYPQGEIGVGDNLDDLFVKVHYSNGRKVDVAFSDMIYEGLDRYKEGEQNVSLTYGGFQQVIPITVRSVNCILRYHASTGGSIDGETTQSVAIGQDGNRVIARPEVGYIFKNWSDGNPNAERKDTKISASRTLIANFEKARYTVVFRYPDGTVAREEIVTYNERPTQVPVPSDPKMQVYGYVFDRWSLPFDKVTQNMTIDPVFVKRATDVKVEVTKNNRGEVLGILDIPKEGYYPKNKEATIRANPMQARSFAGWQIKKYDGTWESITVTDIKSFDNFKVIEIGFAGNDITFEAGQTGDSLEYYITFTPNSNTDLIEMKADFVYDVSTITFINSMSSNVGNIEKTVNLPNGEAIGGNIADPVGSGLGYSFIGWFRESNNPVDLEGNEIAVQAYDTFTQPTTLIARWQKVYCSVTFLKGDGDLDPRTVYVLYQNTLAAAVQEPVYKNPVATNGIPTQIPKRSKYIFVGWYLVGDGNILTDVVIDEDYKVYEDINVRPKFVPIEHNLTVTINGAGRTQRRIEGPNSVFTEVPAGNNAIQEIHQYIYRFTANAGYQIEYIQIEYSDIDGYVQNYGRNVQWADIEIFYPTTDIYITVEFIPKTYVVTVQNGVAEDAGTIRYLEKQGDTMVERISSSPVINLHMEHNTSRNLYVTALATHFIESVTVGGQSIGNIPASTSEYTIVLTPAIITADTTIVIEYRPFAYRADFAVNPYVNIFEAAYNAETQSYYSVPKSPTYGFGQNPMFLFSAADGYYITGLKINGKNVDLYSPEPGFEIFEIFINRNQPAEEGDAQGIKDSRITDFIFIIEGINSDYNVQALYAPLYYDVKVTRNGRGAINFAEQRVAYNDSVQIHAETDGGYYVKSYTINGEVFDFDDMLELQTIDITNIKEDKIVTVTFSIATYVVTFDGSSNGGRYSSVRSGNGTALPLNASFTAEHNSSNRFTVIANTGYYITNIIINGTPMVIPNGVTEQLVQLDNVDRAFHIAVHCAIKTFVVKARINNDSYGSVTAETTVEYGKTAELDIVYNPGYTLKSVSQGMLSEDNTKLRIQNVTENKLIIVELEPRQYRLTSTISGGGNALHPLLALYGEEVTIQLSAFEGFALQALDINGAPIALSGEYENYFLIYTVTEDADIAAEFVPVTAGAPLAVSIVQSGGQINGQSGDYNTTVATGLRNMALVTAPQGFYISSITGQTLGGYISSYALDFDGSIGEYTVNYLPIPYTLSINTPLNGTATLLVSDSPTDGFAEADSAQSGQYIRIVMTPDEGYTLDTLKINGVVITSYIADGYYTYSGITANQTIEISYKLIQLNITTEVTEGYGTISAPSNTFEYGAATTIKIIPAIGYKINTVMINGFAITDEQELIVIATQMYTIAAGSAASKADILVRVSFARIYHRVDIELVGNGKTDQANFNEIAYGDTFFLDITADEHNYIEAVEIDGIRVEISNTNLQNYTFNNVTQKYTAGRFRLLVTKDLQIVVYYTKNVYSVTVMPSVNGVTSINLLAESGEDAALNISSVEHGRSIQISMLANAGYNISRLYINSVEINNFKHDNINPNNNRLINYIYSGNYSQGVNTNLLIRVDYEINYYKFQFRTVNESPNFKEFDLVSSSYGTLSVLGSYALNGNVYSGIPHGENFRLSINPVREKGYVISGVTITYMDPTSQSQTVLTINPQVGGIGATVLRTGATVFFSQLMGQYASAMVGDVQLIEVRFTKETFIFDQLVETAPNTGTIVTRFYHPNDSSRAMTVGSEEPTTLILVDGKFEYGLGYTVSVAPAPGHTRTEFYYIVGGTMVDRSSSVRANSYNSIIQYDIYARVKYVVNNHPINFSYYVYDKKGDLINNPGTSFATIRLTIGSSIYEPAGTNTLTQRSDYGAQLGITLIPNEGYYIDSFVVGTQTISNIPDRNSEYTLNRLMTDGVLNITVVYKVRSFSIDFTHEDDDGKNSVVFESVQAYPELPKIPWAETAVLRVSTDPGYDLMALEVLQNGVWTDVRDRIQKNVLNPRTMQYRDIVIVENIREDISVRAVYQRKEYEIKVIVNDLDIGQVKVDVIGSFYPNYTDIPQTYSEKVEYIEDWIYDPIIDDYYWGVAEHKWDIISMQVKHYDELMFYLLPNNGYRVKELEGGLFDRVVVALYKYVNGERVPVTDNYNVPIVYNISTTMWQQNQPDYRRFTLPAGVKVSSDIEIEIDFVIKTYSVSISKTPTDLAGVVDSAIVVEKGTPGDYKAVQNGDTLKHFDNIRITLTPVYGLSLDRMRINDRIVPYTSYTCENNRYVYVFELEINDTLLNGRNLLNIQAQLRKNVYNTAIEIYDNKSDTLTVGNEAPTLKVETVEMVTHGNTLIVMPILSEGYSVVAVIINGVNYSSQISNPNAQFSLTIADAIVDGLDVHDSNNNTLLLYFVTAINLHVSSIRGFVYEIEIDGYSDIAGDTIVTYNPEDTMVIVGDTVKYEYFTNVRVSAVARSTPEKTYRFAYYQEQVGSGWQIVRDGERGVTLSGEGNSIMEYQIRTDMGNNVSGDRYFRAVYYRVLTVTVTVMPQYKYVSGYSTTGNMRYMPYVTVEATVGTNTLEDKNPMNQWIYQQAQQNNTNAYVESYTYYVDSGSFLRLTATDHDTRNMSAMAFYDRQDSTTYRIITGISTTGTRVLEDRDIYLVARNQTMLSFEIKTIENMSGINGGSLVWSVQSHDNVSQPATIFRGSMNSAKVLDTVTITVRETQNYRFTGLYLKNIDEEKTLETGELVFKSEGAVNEWTWVDTSTDLINVSVDAQGNMVYKIFVTSNMVMKFEFYRTFEVRYSADYQDKGPGIGDVVKDASASAQAVYTHMNGSEIEYAIYDYNSQIKLITPPTDENYQFVGWFVNGDNIYRNLQLQYPDSSLFSYWFRLYQNSAENDIYDGMELRVDGVDVYSINIVAVYQPIYKMTIINEAFFYDADDDHWNSWVPSTNVNVTFYEHFTIEQVINGESGEREFALPQAQEIKSIYMDEMPTDIMSVYNQTVPVRAISSEYDGALPPWSELRKLINANPGVWAGRKVHSTSNYYKLLLKNLNLPELQYNNWTDNILQLQTFLMDGMALVEWQYYDWTTNQFVEIPYVSGPVYNKQGQIISYTNNAKKESYSINLAQSNFIDHTKPFIIRPLYQKKVNLTLNKKAYYYYLNDSSTNGNSAQTPQIYASPGTDTYATFNYYTKCLIVPRAASGYRFIGWYKTEFGDSADISLLDETLIESVVPNETTAAWQVHLKFDFYDPSDPLNNNVEQNNRYIFARYIKQWRMSIRSHNIATGDYVKHDAPKLVLNPASLPVNVPNTPGATYQNTRSRYILHEVELGEEQWFIDITIDAGLHFEVNTDRTVIGNGTNIKGFNPQYDKQYDYTPFRTGAGEDSPTFNSDNEVVNMILYSCANRSLRIRYESFGEMTFSNLMWYAGVRLTDIMAGYVKARFPNDYDPVAPIVIFDADDGVIDGVATFNRVPIRDINYLGTGSALTYDYVPYGYKLAEDRRIKVTHTTDERNYSMFNSQNEHVRKKVTINYQQYKLFGIQSKTTPPGTASNPYLIGVGVDAAGTLSSVAEARQQFRNIEVFFDSNGASCEGVNFKLMQDIHLNAVTVSDPTRTQVKNAYSWVPICSKDGNGFDGVLDGNNKRLRSLNVEATEAFFTTNTSYDYMSYGYGIFSSIKNGTVKNIILGTATIIIDIMRDAMGNSMPGIATNVGYLAARVSGENTVIDNVKIEETFSGGYEPGHNIYIKTGASNVGIIAGSYLGVSVMQGQNEVLKSKLNNILLTTNITIYGQSYLGGAVGNISKAIITNVRDNSGTLLIYGYNSYIGGLFGAINDCNVSSSYVSGTFKIGSDSSNFAGGFAGGILAGDFGTIVSGCYVTGGTSSYVQVSSAGNGGVAAGASVMSGSAGGFAGYNIKAVIDNCSIRGFIKLYGFYCGGLVGTNMGTIKNCVLNVASNDFNVEIETPSISNGGYGIIVGANLYYAIGLTNYNGLVTDCGVLGTGTNVSYNKTNTKLYVYPVNRGTLFTPSIDQLSAADTLRNAGYTSVGGVVGYNSGRVFNSYMKRTKALFAKNAPPAFIVHLGGVVGFNDVGSISQGRGVSSCYSDGNALILINTMHADNASGAGNIGIGGVVGGTKSYNQSTNASHFSVRYCYAINNSFRMYSAAFGDLPGSPTGREFDGYWWFDVYEPQNNETTLNLNVGLVVGGATPQMSRAYYSYGITRSSDWAGWQDTYGLDDNRLSESYGSVFRDGPSSQRLLFANSIPDLESAYGKDRRQNRDRSYKGRTVLLNIRSAFVSISRYTEGMPADDYSAENSPAFCGPFVGGATLTGVTDSRVIRTGENGNLVYEISFNDWDNGNYVGTTRMDYIISNYLVANQTAYTNFTWPY